MAQIDDVIAALQELKAKGETEVMFDVFKHNKQGYWYCGITREWLIDRTADGVYPILSGLGNHDTVS